MLSASLATTDASESLNEEWTVQMNFVDHVSNPNSLKGSIPTVLPADVQGLPGENHYLAEFATVDRRKDSANKSLTAVFITNGP